MVMDHSHPRWNEFLDRLEGPEGCDFKEKTPGDANSITWKCNGGKDKTFATRILKDMDLSETEIQDSLDYFDAHGGHCDCEILFNVAT